MIRDIDKYRVYDTKLKEYISPYVFVDYHGELCANGLYYPPPWCEHCIVERCTGQLDANELFIYEHDIVECVTGARGVVRWFPEKCAFMVDTKPYSTQLCHTQKIVGVEHEEKEKK